MKRSRLANDPPAPRPASAARRRDAVFDETLGRALRLLQLQLALRRSIVVGALGLLEGGSYRFSFGNRW